MVRFNPTKIPRGMIPEGIKTCLENGIRLSNDSILLIENEQYPTGLVILISALEEFAKSKLLYKYYKLKRDIPKPTAKQYFGEHVVRFEEIARIIFEDDPKIPKEELERIIQETSKHYQKIKEGFLYVDWQFYKWTSPLEVDLPPDTELPEKTKREHYQKYVNKLIKITLNVLRRIKTEPSFLKILKIPPAEVPDHKKILDIIKGCLSGNQIEYEIRIAINERSILILMNKLNPKINSQTSVKIKKAIQEKYSDRSVKIYINKNSNFESHVYSSYICKMYAYVNFGGAILKVYAN